MSTPPVGIKQVAQRAGVSPGTVSNVLNRPQKVASATRERVEAAIRELGFVRNGSASSLRVGQGRAIGLMVLDLSNPFFHEAARGVEDVVGAHGYAVLLASSRGRADREERNLTMLAEHRVRGVLVTPVEDDLRIVTSLRERGVPVVLLDHPAPGSGQCAVAVDDVAGGAMAADHLLQRGARQITYLSGPTGLRQCADRRDGVLRALGRAGVGPDALTEIRTGVMDVSAGQAAAEEILAGPRPPEAVFCANDLLALGVMRGLLNAGLRIPDDVRVIGYDDIGLSAAAAVPLTSIRQPTYQLGRIATDLLLDECDNPAGHAHQQIMFQPELVARASTGS